MIRSRRTAGAVLSLPLAAVLVLAACTGGHSGFPSSLLSATTTTATTFPDFSSVTLGAVGGVTTITVSVTPGTATVSGQVLDDVGAPVPSATVHLERVVGNQLASADVAAGPDGTFSAPGIIGGLYRVRAWRAPDLAIVDPQIFFLGASEAKSVNLQLQRFTGEQVTSSIAPSPPIIGQPANLVVLVAVSAVAADGTVHGQPKAGAQAALVGDGSWTVQGSASQTTGPSGTVSWQVSCGALGQQSLSVIVDAKSFPLNLPACSPVPTTTTTTTGAPSTSSTISGETTTTRRRTG